MGTGIGGLWQQTVKALQDATTNAASCASRPLYAGVMVLLEELKNLPPPPKSIWKKLVQQQQVRTDTTHTQQLYSNLAAGCWALIPASWVDHQQPRSNLSKCAVHSCYQTAVQVSTLCAAGNVLQLLLSLRPPDDSCTVNPCHISVPCRSLLLHAPLQYRRCPCMLAQFLAQQCSTAAHGHTAWMQRCRCSTCCCAQPSCLA